MWFYQHFLNCDLNVKENLSRKNTKKFIPKIPIFSPFPSNWIIPKSYYSLFVFKSLVYFLSYRLFLDLSFYKY